MKGPTEIIVHKKSGMTLADAMGFTIIAVMMGWLIFFRN